MTDDMHWQDIAYIPEVSDLQSQTKDIIKKVCKEGDYKWTEIIVAFHTMIGDAIYAAELELEDEKNE